jgi:hypothetical protein
VTKAFVQRQDNLQAENDKLCAKADLLEEELQQSRATTQEVVSKKDLEIHGLKS